MYSLPFILTLLVVLFLVYNNFNEMNYNNVVQCQFWKPVFCKVRDQLVIIEISMIYFNPSSCKM